ncbi:nicotinate phosphoribosyltransferase [bacterium]|nr:nicotinate phosphoribosyltransferase [bacterium]
MDRLEPSVPDPDSSSLLTDFYQLTMAYSFWKAGMEKVEGTYHLFFRSAPFNGNYCICCGLERVISFIEDLRFLESDLSYLATLNGNDGKPLFEKGFLAYLQGLKFTCQLDAIPEGTIVFPFEPLLRIQGPLIQCQLLETPLLNIINFQSLIATKASRIVRAAQGDPVLEFGARRAQGLDGALTASRAAFIGGCSATSNVLAGKKFGIPVKGTIAHSWVMAFETELEAFETYADIQPNNCVLLVDTYSTLAGVKNAIEVGKRLHRKGFELSGIRLDSGDLAYLSIEARRMLDEAGFSHVRILASNDLDENIIQSLKTQNAKIDIWGVGTKLITAFDHPALNGVFKLSAIRKPGGIWENKIKISNQSTKVTTPGILQVRRFRQKGQNIADMIYDIRIGPDKNGCKIVDPFDVTRQKEIDSSADFTDLLIPIFVDGHKVIASPSLARIKSRVDQEKKSFHPTVLRLDNPHLYPVGNEKQMNDVRTELMIKARN